jgi:amidase
MQGWLPALGEEIVMDRDEPGGSKTREAASSFSRRELLASFGGGVLLSAGGAWAGRVLAQSPAPPADWHYTSLSVMARLIEAGEVSPVELTRHLLDRIAVLDADLHSYVTVMDDQAMASARAAEAEIRAGRYRGPLHGIPIGVKDLCYTRGTPTMGGTRVLADFVPGFDATVVARLRAAGAVILGKLTLCEGAMGPYHPDLQVPVNPWDATRWSGVSSSGSGVATAAGLCFASIGTDTGGSIRYPSAANGCVGLKPTYGRVSRHGVLALAESLDHVGPMARTVEDTAIVFEGMAGFDPNDPTSLTEPVQPVRAGLSRGIAGLKVGFDRRYSSEGVELNLVRALDLVLAELTDLGAEVVEVAVPDVGPVADAWWTLSTVEAAAFHADTYPSRADDYGPGFREVLRYGLGVSGVAYANAARMRAEFTGRLNRVLRDVDCLVCPSMSNAARPKLADPFGFEDESDWARLVSNDVHTKPFNFSGSPTLSVPCGFTADGLPFSVQFVGRSLSEATLCRAGHAYEQATRWHTRHPPR